MRCETNESPTAAAHAIRHGALYVHGRRLRLNVDDLGWLCTGDILDGLDGGGGHRGSSCCERRNGVRWAELRFVLRRAARAACQSVPQ